MGKKCQSCGLDITNWEQWSYRFDFKAQRLEPVHNTCITRLLPEQAYGDRLDLLLVRIMLCPHCKTAFHPAFGKTRLIGHDASVLMDKRGQWEALAQACPECDEAIVILQWGTYSGGDFYAAGQQLAYPKKVVNRQLPPGVPKELAKDYVESSLVLDDSPKASAAVSRRCLQTLLRNYAKVKPGDLADEIQAVLDSKTLPSHIAQALDGVRNVGNFAAHPIKSQKTGEIFDVEPGEAEWNLETLEALFDFYFVQPTRLEAKRQALNKKLTDAGKPPMK